MGRRCRCWLLLGAVGIWAGCLLSASAYVDTPPPTLGSLCVNTTSIVELRIEKVSKEKNVVVYRKVRDLKDKYPAETVKCSLNRRSGSMPQDFTPERVQQIMQQLTPGKAAILFSNGHTPDRKFWGCHVYTDAGWYSCHWWPDEEQWWHLCKEAPDLLRAYSGPADRLAGAIADIVAGKEVIVPCLVDGKKEKLVQRKVKTHYLRASLKLLDYNPKRDFVKGE